MKKIPNIPDAFKYLPDSTELNSRDVAGMFGYSHSTAIPVSEKSGFIPRHDTERRSNFSSVGCRNPGHFWKLGTIRKWRELAIAESNKK